MIEKNWTANEKKTLNEFLRQKIPELLEGEISNSKIRRLIVSGAVYINSRQCRIPSFKINSGTAIKVLIDKEKFFFEKQPEDADFELTENDVLFEDESHLVCQECSGDYYTCDCCGQRIPCK